MVLKYKLWIFSLMVGLFAGSCRAQALSPQNVDQNNVELAAEYSAAHNGDALLVVQNGEVVLEEYQNGFEPGTSHVLASGTKSFSCAIAVSAIQDGLLSFDEPVSATITEWSDDPVKSTITVRQLLSLVSGLPPGESPLTGGKPIRESAASDAINLDLIAEPGEAFYYGQSNYQVFGELIRRKLQGQGRGGDAASYLQYKVLNPIGLTEIYWLRDKNKQPALGGGAFTTAKEWAKYGELILNNGAYQGKQILEASLLEECFKPNGVIDAYGLTWWLNTDGTTHLARQNGIEMEFPDRRYEIPMAAGAFNQRLYLIRERNMVVVRFGRRDNSWSDVEFLARLLDGERYELPPREINTAGASKTLAERQLNLLERELKLEEEQVEEIKPIFERHYELTTEFLSSMDEMNRLEKLRAFRKMKESQEQMDGAVQTILTEDQFKGYLKIVEEQRSKTRERFGS